MINTLIDLHHLKQASPYYIAISYLTSKQKKIKSPIVDINHHLNQVLPAFDSLNKGLLLGL